MKNLLSIISLSIIFNIYAQEYSNISPPAYIKTLHWFNPQTNDNTPIIALNKEYLILSFDDLNAQFQKYYYTVEHYNADWTPSGIFKSEYLNGYTSNYITQSSRSFNTYTNYTNYRLQIPNNEFQLKLAGNYVLKIYTNDEDKPLFTKRFAIYENNVTLGITEDRFIGKGDLNQRVNVIVSSNRVNLTESPNGARLFIMKNGNWNDNLTLTSPQFTQPYQLTYNDANNLFEGNSEYLWFDTKNIETPSLTTEKVIHQDSIFHTVLRPNFIKNNLGYYDEPDINGSFYIRNARLNNEALSYSEADYTWVHFALEDFDSKGGIQEVYVVGAFNNWELLPEYQLKASENNLYEVSVFLKQGYYNYQYAVKNTSTEKVSLSTINGSYWQTENLYQALFYYRPWGVRYDVLMGYSERNSRN